MKYLDYTDKTNIIRTFKSLRTEVKLRNHKIVIFEDFSVEVTRKRRAFSNVCSTLFRRQTQFALLYPVILKAFHKDGPPVIYRSPEEAMKALNITTATSTTSSSTDGTRQMHASGRMQVKTEEESTIVPHDNDSPPKDQRKRQVHKMVK